MIILNTPQGSNEWLIERVYRLTASNMSKSITSEGKLSGSQAALANIDKLIAGLDLAALYKADPTIFDDMDERAIQNFISNYTGEKFSGNLHTQRGNELEADAIAKLSLKIGKPIEDAGMVIMGDKRSGSVSCSPDGLIYEGDKIEEGAEVKCPCLATWYGYVGGKTLPDVYKLQVHASMAVCEVDLWHFAAYFPGKPLFHVPVRRDAFTDQVEKSLHDFQELYRQRFSERVADVENLKGKAVA